MSSKIGVIDIKIKNTKYNMLMIRKIFLKL